MCHRARAPGSLHARRPSTLQNTVYSFNPYKVQNRRQFEGGLSALGYEMTDAWENADMSCHIPLHRERTVERYSGFYFRATR